MAGKIKKAERYNDSIEAIGAWEKVPRLLRIALFGEGRFPMQTTWMLLTVLLSICCVLLSACARKQDTRQSSQQTSQALGQPASQAPGDYQQVMTVDGRERSYIVHIPPTYKGQSDLPLVIVLHGGGGNAQKAIEMTGMSDKADKEGFIVVYPNGTGQQGRLTWNAGFCCSYAMDNNVDDVKFIRTLIESLQNEYKTDPKRVGVMGLSNGAMMAYRLGCELSDKIAAIAPISGSLGADGCQPTDPLPVIIFHGTADKNVPYNGGKGFRQQGEEGRVDTPVSYAVSFWVQHNQCPTDPQRQEKGSIVQETYGPCKDGAEVVLYTIIGGGHAVPGGKKGDNPTADEPTQEISAADLTWDFFASHPKR